MHGLGKKRGGASSLNLIFIHLYAQVVNKTAAVLISDLAIDVIPKFKSWVNADSGSVACDLSRVYGESCGPGVWGACYFEVQVQ